MKILLNGQEKSLGAPVTVAVLLQEMGLGDRRVAVEVNREIVPRSRHNDFQLQDNDRVEVVFAIGGGGMSREQDAAEGRAGAPRQWGCGPEAGCSAPCSLRSLLSSPLPDPVSRVPRATLARTHEVVMRPAANAAGQRQHNLSVF